MGREKKESAKHKRIKPLLALFEAKGANVWDKEEQKINSLTIEELKNRLSETGLKNIDICQLLCVDKSTITRFNSGSFNLKFKATLMLKVIEEYYLKKVD